MSELHVRQLQQYFINSIANHIDISDLSNKKKEDIEQAKLSRALTAFSLSGLTGTPTIKTVKYVLDGERDQGIDGCYYDDTKNTLLFVQSKWHNKGTKTISKGDILKFLHGVKLVLSANWDTFSNKFKNNRELIENVLLKPDLSVIIAVAFTGDNRLSEECEECLNQFEEDQNQISDYLKVKTLDLRTLHRYFRTATLATQPPFTTLLLDWGQATEPYNAIYGKICCEDLAKLYSDIGEPLFEPNIRCFLGDGEVNNQIMNTLITKPEEFWYLNNGVTGICTKIAKSPLGGDSRQAGNFVFDGIQIVNGAQTIGSILKTYEKHPDKVKKAFTTFKVISLEGAPLDFTDTVTIATNKQNKVEEKDFLTLDQNQNRIKNELAANGTQYAFRSGETVSDKNIGFDVNEAMVALACSHSDISNAVLAKRNIGILLDKKSTPYQLLFNSNTTGIETWEKVKKLREIEATLSSIQASLNDQKTKQILTHGNRVISWSIFNIHTIYSVKNAYTTREFIIKTAEIITEFLKNNYPESYLAVFFKNTKKCTELAINIKATLDKDFI